MVRTSISTRSMGQSRRGEQSAFDGEQLPLWCLSCRDRVGRFLAWPRLRSHGKMLSFVYDVADLYKTETTIPAAFRAAADPVRGNLEGSVRRACRDSFAASHLLQRVVADLQKLFPGGNSIEETDSDQSPGDLWDPEVGVVAGGQSYGGNEP